MDGLVDRLVTVLRVHERVRRERELVIGFPCWEDKIVRLEDRIGWDLPRSYRDFLLAANGVRLLDGTEPCLINLVAAEDLPLPKDEAQRETLGEDDIRLSDILVVGAVPMHDLYVFLDKKTDETVRWMAFDAVRFASFADYLEAEIAGLARARGYLVPV